MHGQSTMDGICFNSRTREGCDRDLWGLTISRFCFNSRTREGCDPQVFFALYGVNRFQFTHPGGVRHEAIKPIRYDIAFQFTHPGGVRHTSVWLYNVFECFNSRTREGCDCSRLKQVSTKYKFQFTHPGGVRHSTASGSVIFSGFNSRTREGCDCFVPVPKWGNNVSIHAPGRGATGNVWSLLKWEDTFQFTHPGGVRRR